jgi:hypothetical protein
MANAAFLAPLIDIFPCSLCPPSMVYRITDTHLVCMIIALSHLAKKPKVFANKAREAVVGCHAHYSFPRLYHHYNVKSKVFYFVGK